jgi:hypothetical protein
MPGAANGIRSQSRCHAFGAAEGRSLQPAARELRFVPGTAASFFSRSFFFLRAALILPVLFQISTFIWQRQLAADASVTRHRIRRRLGMDARREPRDDRSDGDELVQ